MEQKEQKESKAHYIWIRVKPLVYVTIFIFSLYLLSYIIAQPKIREAERQTVQQTETDGQNTAEE